jgi:hypothetical protein
MFLDTVNPFNRQHATDGWSGESRATSCSERRLDITSIQDAFSPSREITEPRKFVGRQDEMLAGISALQNDGGFITIYGPRGVGKSSIAYQLKLIAEGNEIVPRALNLQRFIPRDGFHYQVHYVRCDTFVRTIPDLMKRILFGDEQNASLFALTSTGDQKLDSLKKAIEAEASAGAFGAKIGVKAKRETSESMYVSDDIVQIFRTILRSVKKDNLRHQGLLILIDEFDIIEDKTGFASIVKNCSSHNVKFGVVGIGHTMSELIRDHNSVGRQIDAIHVGKMEPYELDLILKRAEYRVRDEIVFEDCARTMITTKAEGFPYFVHLLGKEAMLLAFRRNLPRINAELVGDVAERIVSGRLPTIYEETYHEALQGSEDREIVLKLCAEHKKEEIHLESIAKVAADMGVETPRQLVCDLARADATQPVLVPIREGYYRFSDPVFRVYAKIRQWEF